MPSRPSYLGIHIAPSNLKRKPSLDELAVQIGHLPSSTHRKAETASHPAHHVPGPPFSRGQASALPVAEGGVMFSGKKLNRSVVSTS